MDSWSTKDAADETRRKTLAETLIGLRGLIDKEDTLTSPFRRLPPWTIWSFSIGYAQSLTADLEFNYGSTHGLHSCYRARKPHALHQFAHSSHPFGLSAFSIVITLRQPLAPWTTSWVPRRELPPPVNPSMAAN